MTLIGVSGAIHAGKDEVANRLVDRWGCRKFTVSQFIIAELLDAYPETLAEYAMERFSAGLHQQMGDALVEQMLRDSTMRTPVLRRLLQEHGTRRRRERQDYWVQRVVAALENAPGPVVIAGVRYQNEAVMIRSRGGCLLQVVRPGRARFGDDHEVEHGLDGWTDWDAVLVNDGTISDLWGRVDAWVLAALPTGPEREEC